jgi:hypothetical protein
VILRRIFTLVLLAGALVRFAPAQDETPYPREIVDWSRCRLQVVQIEFVEKLTTRTQTLTSGRLDARLALIKVQGMAPESGYVSVGPLSFGAQFIYRGIIRMETSKAWGIRGKNIDTGKVIENWESDPDWKANIGVRAGEDVSAWFAVVIPKETSAFRVIVPSLIEATAPPEKQKRPRPEAAA